MKRKLIAVLALALVFSLFTFGVSAATNNVSSAYSTGITASSDGSKTLVVTDVNSPKAVASEGLASSAGKSLPSNAKAVDVCDIHWSDGSEELDSNLTITLKGTNVKSGSEVYVLHDLHSDGEWVKYSATNKGSGTIEFTIPSADGLSPFVVCEVTTTPSDQTSPSTADVSRFVALAALTCAVAAAGVFASSFKKED